MPAIAVIGAQWGDEGKGKIVDSLATQPNVVACGRFTGGDNAGHTIKPSPNEPSIALNIIPSSIVTGKPSIVGHGVLVNPITLYNEIEKLHGLGISTENLSVSLNSHVIMPYHRLEDYCLEKCKGSESVGTTNRGIGPCAADKANRIGIQMWELLNRELLSERLNFVIGLKQPLLEHVYQWDGIITDEKLRTAIGGYFEGHKIKKDAILDDCVALGNKLKKYLKETRELVNKYIKAGVVILESAQGALLDPDLGTWPYVTSTNPTIGGLLIGSGISHKEIAYVLGVMKAYTTRVGGGPFPTELKDETG
ncbi:MAG: adenylosuccinate synthetase, partial [Candidatus Aenigmarchaeota archaeon]|nr:adenylosuccinate synthetase [Candidatus Aenigmarchaeota archaeon]